MRSGTFQVQDGVRITVEEMRKALNEAYLGEEKEMLQYRWLNNLKKIR